MTKTLFFDTDCLSAFLWINNQSILAKLYHGRIVIPIEVYRELSAPSIPHLKERIDIMVDNNDVKLESIQLGTEEYKLYRKMTTNPDPGEIIIGKGEAAAIALAKENNGILASNNLKDVSSYVFSFGLQHMTTGDVLKEAMDAKIITENEGNIMWAQMIKKRRQLGHETFTDFLKSK